MIRSSVDLPQPDGPIRETNSPGCTSRSIRSSASTSPRSKRFESPVTETAAAAAVAHATCSGARRTSSRSAIATTEKKMIPSPAAMMFVAQRLSGEVM